MVEVDEQTDPRGRLDDFNPIKRLLVKLERANEIIFERGKICLVKRANGDFGRGVLIRDKRNFFVAQLEMNVD